MARLLPSALVLALCIAFLSADIAAAKKSPRKLNGYESSSGTVPSSSATPVIDTPTTNTPISDTPTTSSPTINLPPLTATPTAGYGSRSGRGTSGYWKSNPGRVPRILSLLSSLAKIFGPRALKYFGSRLTLLGAVTSTDTDARSSLAREGTASLFNAYTVTGFPFTSSDVFDQFNAALDTPELAAQQAMKFQQANEGV